MRTFTDRVAVVTGAGSGIGRALALELARRGAHLAITDREEAPLLPVAAEIAAMGRSVSCHAFDVADRAAWPAFVEDVLARHGRIELAVNNAGVSLTGPFLKCSLEDLEWQLGVNLWGVVYGCHFLLPELLRQPEAHLVNLSSIFGILAPPDNAAYAMSKHAVKALTEALEVELWDTHVGVTTVHPGAVNTRIVEDGRFRAGGVALDRAGFFIRRGMPPSRAAKRIADGVARGERRILVGADAKVIALLQRLMPVGVRTLTAWLTAGSRRG